MQNGIRQPLKDRDIEPAAGQDRIPLDEKKLQNVVAVPTLPSNSPPPRALPMNGKNPYDR